MAITDLYLDNGIETAPEGHKHYREGWVNVECPHCSGSHGYHLGFNTNGNYFYCWRCGPHPIHKTLSKLLGISLRQIKDVTDNYELYKRTTSSTNSSIKIRKHHFKLPTEVAKMSTPHRRYLEKRNFDPDYIEKEWQVQGTSPTSQLDNGEGKIIYYKYRILIPIYWKNEIVSFQCRDYTDKQHLKYMACPMSREIVHHKCILYGHRSMWGDRIGICVEGALDVWRLGRRAFGTLGTGYTNEQVRLMAKLFSEIFIVFDPEFQAQERAKKLQGELLFRGVRVHVYEELTCDPADLSQDDADHLLKELKLASGVTSDSSS